MDTPASVLKDSGEMKNKFNMYSTVSPALLTSSKKNILAVFPSVAVSCVRCPRLHCPCASWPTARTTPRAWSEEAAPSASVLRSLVVHAARSWSASTLLTETPTCCSLTSRTGLKLTSPCRYSQSVHGYDCCTLPF